MIIIELKRGFSAFVSKYIKAKKRIASGKGGGYGIIFFRRLSAGDNREKRYS